MPKVDPESHEPMSDDPQSAPEDSQGGNVVEETRSQDPNEQAGGGQAGG